VALKTIGFCYSLPYGDLSIPPREDAIVWNSYNYQSQLKISRKSMLYNDICNASSCGYASALTLQLIYLKKRCFEKVGRNEGQICINYGQHRGQ